MGFEVNFKKIAEAFSNASKSGNLKIPEAKTAETSASAFEEQQTRLDNNFSSITAILNNDYDDETIRPKQENPWCRAIEENSSLEHMAAQYYGHKDDEELTQQEKNSFAWSLLDHNRWMIDDVNRTYLAQQVAQDLPDIQEGIELLLKNGIKVIFRPGFGWKKRVVDEFISLYSGWLNFSIDVGERISTQSYLKSFAVVISASSVGYTFPMTTLCPAILFFKNESIMNRNYCGFGYFDSRLHLYAKDAKGLLENALKIQKNYKN